MTERPRRARPVAGPTLPSAVVARQRALATQHDEDLARRLAERCAGPAPAEPDDASFYIEDAEGEAPPPVLREPSEEPAPTVEERQSTDPAPAAGKALQPDAEGVTTVELVTPADAERWLEQNTDNRPISDARVEQYAEDIRRGAWRVTHQGLAFGADGALYDGQHRLWAVVKAGVPARMRVTRGLPPSVRPMIDQGRARSVADSLRIGAGTKHGARLASWCRVGAYLRMRRPVSVSHAVVTAWHAARRATVEWFLARGPKARPLNRTPVVAALVFAHPAAPAEVEAFTELYIGGAGLDAGSPVLALRRYVLERVQTVREDERRIALKALRAVLAHLRGESIELLKESDEAFEYFAKRQPDAATTTDTSRGDSP